MLWNSLRDNVYMECQKEMTILRRQRGKNGAVMGKQSEVLTYKKARHAEGLDEVCFSWGKKKKALFK